MLRKALGATAGVVLLASMLSVTTGTGVSWAGNPKAVGTVGCKVTGTGGFFPHLTLGGSPGGVKFHFKATSKDCSSNATVGGVAVNITGVTMTGSGFWNLPSGGSGSSCASLPSDLLGVVNVKYVWTSVPPIATTKVTTSGGVPWVIGGPVFHFTLPSGAVITSSTGSFSPVVSQVINLTTNIASVCAAGWGPYPTFAITGGFFNLS